MVKLWRARPILLLMLVLSGCAGRSGERELPASALPVAADAPLQALRQQSAQSRRLADWLEAGRQALAADRLMLPAEDNAYDWFLRVLQEDGENPIAHWGMRQINDRYLELARQAFEQGDAARAETLLQRAGQIASSPEAINALRQRYRKAIDAVPVVPSNTYLLPLPALTGRDQQIQQLLAEVAVRARDLPSRLLIVARNDAEGRWIYQNMREAVDGYRLRGNIQLGKPPRVVLIDLES